MDSIVLDHCWVCRSKFVGCGGSANREEHHIVPRAAGGSDGPTVSLCDGHHTCLHKIALSIKSKKPYFQLLLGEPDEAKQKILWLATRVFNAFEAVKNDPNKRVVVILTLDRKKQHQLEVLKKVYPSLRSREALINLALDNLYRRHFSD